MINTKEFVLVRIMITKYFLISLMLSTFILSQNKFGFVQSDRIRAEYEEFKEAEGQLMLEYQQINAQFNNMVVQLDSIKKAFESQRLMSSPDWRKEKEAEIQSREASIQRFQVSMVGPEGELSMRQQKLEFDILSKVKRAVDKVAASKKIDFIIDGSTSLLYGNPTYDLTDDVLFELRKYQVSGKEEKK